MNKALSEQLNDFMHSADELQSQRALRAALRALPAVDAPSGEPGWQQIQNRLSASQDKHQNSSRYRTGWLRREEWMGLAAVLILTVLVMFSRPVAEQGLGEEQLAGQQHELQEWVAHSQQLENHLRMLRQLDSSQVISGQQAITVDELERMIGLVDLQLAAAEIARGQAGGDPLFVYESTGLWQQRVLLLSELLANEFGESVSVIAEDAVFAETASQQI